MSYSTPAPADDVIEETATQKNRPRLLDEGFRHTESTANHSLPRTSYEDSGLLPHFPRETRLGVLPLG